MTGFPALIYGRVVWDQKVLPSPHQMRLLYSDNACKCGYKIYYCAACLVEGT